MPGRGRVAQGLLSVAATVGVVATFVAWCAAANYLAFVTAAALECRNLKSLGGLVAAFWVAGSLILFLLLGAGMATLMGHVVDRGRRARWIGIGICAVVVVLSTWAYVVTTHGVIDRLATSDAVPVLAAGKPDEKCSPAPGP
jgi:uncharacterized BrkB/YihY/UPF0761 family membrane protein